MGPRTTVQNIFAGHQMVWPPEVRLIFKIHWTLWAEMRKNRDPSDFAWISYKGRLYGYGTPCKTFMSGIKRFDLQRSDGYSNNIGPYGQKLYKIQIDRKRLPPGRAVVCITASFCAKGFYRASYRLTSRGQVRSRAEKRDPSDFAQIWLTGRVWVHAPLYRIFLPGIKWSGHQRSD